MTASSAALAVSTTAYDNAKAEAFAGRLMGALNESALVLMTSLGHRTGLFDAFARATPCTIKQLAAEADLAERYVREWLAVMVTSRVAEYDPATGVYSLPAEHASFLTKDSPTNIALTTQYVTVAAQVEDEMVTHFKTGGGTHYHDYERFHEVMAEQTRLSVVSHLIDDVLPIEPGLKARLERGIEVVDVGCGAGEALLLLARTYPKSRFLGLDLCDDAFAETEQTAKAEGLDNLTFREFDISSVKTLGAFDLVFAFDAIHDQKDPQGMLDTIRRSLKPGGVFFAVDIGGSSKLENNLEHPIGAYLYMISTMHCTAVSLGQGGVGLGTMWGVELAQEMLAQAGFTRIGMTRLPHDPFNAYFIAKA
jgi:SAM-dependent methyltransferase